MSTPTVLKGAPHNILKYAVHQFAKVREGVPGEYPHCEHSYPCEYGCEYAMRARPQVLPNDMEARRNFVTSGGLKKVQELQAEQVPR